jgi:tellurite resistance protein TerC
MHFTLDPNVEMLLLWIGFHVLIGFLLFLDLGIIHRKESTISMKEAFFWSLFWIGLSLLFNLFIVYYRGHEAGLQFFTGYIIEKSLSVDNLFVFALIFAYFKIPPAHQYRVLYWGIIGAIVFRLSLILIGAELIESFHWLIYVLGALLCVTGVRFFSQKEVGLHPENNVLVILFKKFFRVAHDYEGSNFFIRKRGVLYATPLFIAHLVIESADLVFAVDSIPAILSITTDTFIVYTSNIFAVLGLRSLYFLLSNSIDRFHALKYGLALILIFIGIKMLVSFCFEITTLWALSVVAFLLLSGIVASLVLPPKKKRQL